MSDLSQIVYTLAVWALPVLLGITVHEVSHGWVARALGDPTAERLGRLSLNPLKHIDPIGTVLVPAVLLLIGGFLFGWAKPVPVDTRNLRDPKKDMALVAIAGPASNLVMAIAWALLLRFAYGQAVEGGFWPGLVDMCVAGVSINIVLMILNLIPLPPLDGGRVAVGLLPMPAARALARVEPYGTMILIGLMAAGVLDKLLSPLVSLARNNLIAMVGLGG